MNHRELFENTVLLRPFDGLGAGVVLGRGPERLVPQRRRPEAEAVRANLEILGLGARGPDRGGHSANERVSVARHMGPGIDVFARVMGPVNRQGHGARVAGDRTLDRQGHGASRSPGSWGQPVS